MKKTSKVLLLALLVSIFILPLAGCREVKQSTGNGNTPFTSPPKVEVEKVALPENVLPLYINEQKHIIIAAKHLPDTGKSDILRGSSIQNLKIVLKGVDFPVYELFVSSFNESEMCLLGLNKIYFSKDFGKSWNSTNNSFNFSTMGFSPERTMYFAGPGARRPCYIYKSTDGTHFTEVYKPHPYHDVVFFTFNPRDAHTIWTFGEYGVFVSKDSGRTFKNLNAPDRAYTPGTLNPYNYSEAYVGLGNYGLYKVSESGTITPVYVVKQPLERFVSVVTDFQRKITYAIDDNGNLFCILKDKAYKLYTMKNIHSIKLLLEKDSGNLYILCYSAYYKVKVQQH